MRHRIAKDAEANRGIDTLPLSQIIQRVNFFHAHLLHVIPNEVRDLAQKADSSHNLASLINELSEVLRSAQDDTH